MKLPTFLAVAAAFFAAVKAAAKGGDAPSGKPVTKPTPSGPSVPVNAILREARADLDRGVSERDRSDDGPLAQIFRDSGWANGVTHDDGGRVHDWCGMSVGSWAYRAGMNPQHRRSFYATQNVRSFFSYGTAGNVHHRTAREVEVDGVLMPIETWHRNNGARRTWVEGDILNELPVERWPLQAGDVLLFDWSGRRDSADHIVLVESFDGRTLKTLEGNADDKVQRITKDLTDPRQRRLVYGFGRFSPLDFTDYPVRRP